MSDRERLEFVHPQKSHNPRTVTTQSSVSASRISVNLLKEMYSKMFLIRIFEEKVIELIKARTLYGTAHACIGQEAVAVGVCSTLRRDDYITSTHRGHGHCIAKGADVGLMMAELMGRAKGYCKGRTDCFVRSPEADKHDRAEVRTAGRDTRGAEAEESLGASHSWAENRTEIPRRAAGGRFCLSTAC